MSDSRVSTISIHTRHIRIGGQFYPLANISRIQTFWFEWGKKLLTAREVTLSAATVLGAFIILPIFRASDTAVIIFLLVAAGIGILAMSRYFARQRRFVLAIEAAGGQSTTLLATTEPELLKIADVLVDAIENPPSDPQLISLSQNIQIGDRDVIYGDKIGRDKNTQFGPSGSINSN